MMMIMAMTSTTLITVAVAVVTRELVSTGEIVGKDELVILMSK